MMCEEEWGHVSLTRTKDGSYKNWRVRLMWDVWQAARASYRTTETKKEPKMNTTHPTAGMSIAERILHVGGRNNAAGYVEFGSIQAVEALVRQVLRDMLNRAPIPADVLVGMYDESPTGDADMIEFARAIERTHGIGQEDAT